MSKKVYSAGIVSKMLWFSELKKTAQIQYEHKDCAKEIILKNNIYQVHNIERANEIYNTCVSRLKDLDEELIDILLHGDTSDVKVVALIAIMKKEKIVFDFVYEVYREKIILGDYEITEKDMRVFFDYKITQSEDVKHWSESTLYKMQSSILRMLIDSGLIIQNGKDKKIEPLLLGQKLENYLRDNMNAYYKAIMGEN